MHSTLSCGHVGDNYTLTTQKWHAKVLAVADASSTFRYILVSRVHKKASKAYLVVNFEIRKSRYSNRKLDKRHSAYWLLTALFARDTIHIFWWSDMYAVILKKEKLSLFSYKSDVSFAKSWVDNIFWIFLMQCPFACA